MENRDLQGSRGGATVRQDYTKMMIFEYKFNCKSYVNRLFDPKTRESN